MKQYTIEEKVIERAYKKLALDALVIQQGRLAEQKSKKFLCRVNVLHDALILRVCICSISISSCLVQPLTKMSCFKW